MRGVKSWQVCPRSEDDMSPRFALTLLCGLALGGAPSSPFAAEAEKANGSKLTIYHWWTSPSEAAAIKALTTLFAQKYPDVAVNAAVSPRQDTAMFHVVSRLLRGRQPPDSFQMDTGYSAEAFIDAGLLSPVDDVWKSE